MNEELTQLLSRENLSLASKQKRLNAYIIDEIILSVIWISVIWDSFVGTVSLEEKILLINSYILEFMLLKFIYHTFFLTQYAASPGKIIMKIRVLEVAYLASPSFLTSINRSSFRLVSEVFLYAGFIWGLLDPNRQTWHDKTARTIVVDV